MLIRNNFLGESAHLGSLPYDLGFRHVDRGLMMRNHQSDKIDVAVSGSLEAPIAMCILSMLATSSDQSESSAWVTAIGEGF